MFIQVKNTIFNTENLVKITTSSYYHDYEIHFTYFSGTESYNTSIKFATKEEMADTFKKISEKLLKTT